MQRLIIAVGGTGQMILHYYAQLVLLGVIKKSFQAVVVDADDCMTSLRCLIRFFDRVAEALGPAAAADSVPKITFRKVSPGDMGATIAHTLVARDLPIQPGYHHPVQAFFSRETLQQTAGQGLYARPALSAVIGLKPVLDEIERIEVSQQSRIVLVSSCIGGTGGGLAIPVLHRLQETTGQLQVSIRAVLLGRYFGSNGEQVSDQVRRFESNKTLFFRAMEASLERLHSFAYIEKPRMVGKIADSESKSHHLPWPAEREPYWQAVRALEYCLSNTTQDVAQRFVDRQVSDDQMRQATLKRDAAERSLQTGISRVRTILEHNLLHLVEQEALARRFWGSALTDFLAAYWRFVRQANPETPSALDRLGEGASEALASWWQPPGGEYGLGHVFPDQAGFKTSIGTVKRIGWIPPRPESPHERFRNPQTAKELIAAATLFCVLNQGGNLMDSVADLLEGHWTALAAYPESVPHLLHWDLAYLWVLGKEPPLRPSAWNERVKGWQKLLDLFLLGETKLEREDVPAPMLGYTQPFGISKITKLLVNGRCAGVLSPVVVVRPLPDLGDSELRDMPGAPHERRQELLYFLRLLVEGVQDLSEKEGNRPLHGELHRILSDRAEELRRLTQGEPQNAQEFDATPLDISLLRTVHFHQNPASADFDRTTVHVSTGRVSQTYLPRCSQCNVSLTRSDVPAMNLAVTGEAIPVSCPGGHTNEVPLDRLMIWLRGGEAVVWTDRAGSLLPSAPGAGRYPPACEFEGNVVKFTWTASVVENNLDRTLRLTFPGRTVRAVSAKEEALYRQPLVPGADLTGYEGLPVRGEWVDAIETFPAVRIEGTSLGYDELKLRGWPFPVNLTFATNSIVKDAGAGIAIYPRPMHANWRMYRLLSLGPNAARYRPWAPDASGALPELRELTAWPPVVSLETADRQVGASWRTLGFAPTRQAGGAASRLCIGVDFGTSNSVLYFQSKGDLVHLQSSSNAVAWTEIQKLLHWVHPPSPNLDLGWFLPAARAGSSDPDLLPSALWDNPHLGCSFVRWSSKAPDGPGFEARHGFKWDRNLQDLSRLRRSYLREVFFFALPVILEKLGARGTPADLDVAFAYPLAFSHPQRAAYRALIDEFRMELESYSGLQASTYAINESLATVRARGAFNPGDVCLVADMGGRTLDVALFTYQLDLSGQTNPRFMHQIGSIDFGGEVFLRAVAKRRAQGGGEAEIERAYWRLRDSVSRGEGSPGHDAVVSSLLERFQPMALEFLRVLLCAFRENPEERRGIRVFLVGNGWRLRDLLSGQRDPAEFTPDYLSRRVRDLGLDEVELSSSAIPGIANSKHWVACGALQAAKTGGADELRGPAFPSRIPAGITIHFAGVNGGASWEPIPWHENVGDGGWSCQGPDQGIHSQTVDFAYDSVPSPGAPWAGHLDAAVPATQRFPEPERLRAGILAAFENGRLTKGPLTLVLENHWKGLLEP